ncbi:MAG: tandem-95 repeat protein [Rickettsiales bacterium]
MSSAQFIPVVLPNEPIGGGIGGPSVPLLGHGGFILVNNAGKATFYEYGHWDPNDPNIVGVITTNTTGNNTNMRQLTITGTMQFDSSGNIMESSLKSALDQVFNTSGLYTTDPGMVAATPFAISDTQFNIIDSTLVNFKNAVNAGNKNYDLFGINCMKFVYEMADAGLLQISDTQFYDNQYFDSTLTVPSVAARAIMSYAGEGYQYFSDLSWLSGNSSIDKVSSFNNLNANLDFGAQLLKGLGDSTWWGVQALGESGAIQLPWEFIIWLGAQTSELSKAIHDTGLTVGEYLSDVASIIGEQVGSLETLLKNTVRGVLWYAPDSIADSISQSMLEFLAAIAQSLLMDPLIIDKNGDGVALDSFQTSAALFDLNEDGTLENTGWTQANSDDSFLVIDKNSNGNIDDISEMFGNQSISGFSELKTYDSNNDNLINSQDTQFNLLKLWNDANANGIVDAGELTTLTENNITEISLNKYSKQKIIEGNLQTAISTVTLADGSARNIHELNFAFEGNTIFSNPDAGLPSGFQIAIETIVLPFSRGYNTLYSWQAAMTLDTQLLAMAQDIAATPITDFHLIHDKFEDFLFRWAGVENVTAQEVYAEVVGEVFDPRKVAFLEKLTGGDFNNPVPAAMDMARQAWDIMFDGFLSRFLVQANLADIFQNEHYDFATDSIVFADSLDEIIANAEALAPSMDASSFATYIYWTQNILNLNHDQFTDPDFDSKVTTLIADFIGVADIESFSIDGRLNIGGSEVDILYGTEKNDLLRGEASNDELYGFGGDDFLEGGKGDDILKGELGNDIYRFSLGDGQDTIDDSGGVDKILMGSGINAADIEFAQVGSDLIINVGQGGDRISIKSFYDNSANRVDSIVFEDGSSFNLLNLGLIVYGDDLANQLVGSSNNDVMYGLAGDDDIRGGAGDDVIEGGLGNDYLVNYYLYSYISDNDTYIFNLGDGQDIIYDYKGNDQIVFGAGITQSDIQLVSDYANNQSLIVKVGSGGDQITLPDFFYNYNNDRKIDTLRFADGSTIALNNGITLDGTNVSGETLKGTSYNDVITGNIGDDNIISGTGDDILTGGLGNDTLDGSNGSDTYIFNLGDGQDIIYDYSGTDEIVFGAGITGSDVQLVSDFANNYSLIVKVGSGGDQITLPDFFYSYSNDRKIETLRFADGSSIALNNGITLDGTNINGETLKGTSSNDVITGNIGDDVISTDYGNDILTGGLGNDTLDGSNGSDTYIFNLGDGQDTIIESWYEADEIVFGAGINPEDVLMEASGSDLVIKIGAGTDQITIQNFFYYSDTRGKVDYLKFADGTIFNITQSITVNGGTGNDKIMGTPFVDVLNGNGGDDYIYGSGDNDTVNGGSGNDILKGGNGDDVYEFSLGDGSDAIYEQGGNDILKFSAGVIANSMTLLRNGTDLKIIDSINSDVITINKFFVSGGNRVESLLFSDGTEFTLSDILSSDVSDTVYSVDGHAIVKEDVITNIKLLNHNVGLSDYNNITLSTAPTNGSAYIDGDNIVYTANANYNGTDSLAISYIDTNGAAQTKIINIDVAPVNDSPLAIDHNVQTNEDTQLEIMALGGASDIDNDIVFLSTVGNPTHGNASISANKIIYTPNINFYGSDSFNYTIADGNGGYDTKTINVDVISVNDSPLAYADIASTDEDNPILIDILSNDSDVEDGFFPAQNISIFTNPTHGVVSIESDGKILYTPDEDFYGQDSFEYRIVDSQGAISNAATVNISIAQINDAPKIIAGSTLNFTEDQASDFNVNAYFYDPDGDSFTIQSISAQNGNIGFSGDIISYNPNSDYNGNEQITINLKDSNGASGIINFSALVAPINDAPIAVSDNFDVLEDTVTRLPILDNDIDIDSGLFASSIINLTTPLHGSITVDSGDGSIIYTPDLDYFGADSFEYTLIDSGGLSSASALVNINVIDVIDSLNLVGTSGIDNLVGNTGNDTLSGLGGNDTLYGEGGDDWLDGGAGGDYIDGGAGVDTVSYASSTVVVDIDLNRTGLQGWGAAGDTIVNVENIIGSDFSDRLAAADSGSIINGGLGNDIINGRDGSDTIYGEAGNDTIYAGGGDDIIDGGAGDDTIYSNGGTNLLIGGAGADYMNGFGGTATASYADSTTAVNINLYDNINTGGDAQGDSLVGVPNIIGSDFDDTIIGDGFANSLYGGLGDDLLAGRGFGGNHMDGGDGVDTVSYAESSQVVSINLDSTGSQGWGASGDTLVSIENLIGSAYNDTLAAKSSGSVIHAGLGNDTINGRAGNDTIYGEDGNDTIYAGAGNDTVYGGAGDDLIYSQAGNNLIVGGAGADTINGFTGIATSSYAGSAAVNVNLATNVNTGGDAQGDVLQGVTNIIGSDFADNLTGDYKDNTITGGSGVDTLTGGSGFDIFKYLTSTDSSIGTGNRDIITDFSHAQGDQIDLSAFTGDFIFMGTNNFTGTNNEVNYSQAGGNTIIAIDSDANGLADFEIGIIKKV